ncbi:MAG TPA: hypothetical protein VF642_10195 [Propionibacteriaceae bacterium]|jgi:hypothetical protein
MTLFLAPDDGPFVFGAFAAHLDQAAPLRPGLLGATAESGDLTPVPDDGVPGPVATTVSAERGLAS